MASSSCTKAYDVFISFRGEDTRRSFTSHLHSALCKASINTYIDDDSLAKGDSVWPALRGAIENSRIAVVIFSINYATSKWCLEELIKILECRKLEGQVVIPVFYEVDPSHVRNRTGSYGEAFAKHEEKGFDGKDDEFVEKKVYEWKTALTEAANISGWDSRSYGYKNDVQLIEKIVEDVSKKLDLISPYELEVKNLVGIEKECEDIKLLLSKKPKRDVVPKDGRVIGIWGMGGIGKTTIAEAVFSEICLQYDSVCFLRNVRDESKRLGLTSLHEKLLSRLLRDEHLKYKHVGSTRTTGRLRNKKVLVVLDDVDNVEQLDELRREYEHAGSESLLIITTRDRSLLRGIVDEDDVYEVKAWNTNKSQELFIQHAFKESRPQKGYENLLKVAVKYAGGVPLALKVLGSHLGRKGDMGLWEEELNKLKNYPNENIQNVLRVSYDGLPILDKKIFLDIAFFFKGQDKDYAERILNACGFFATNGITFLEDKALITITYNKKIQMHDLLEEMGLAIVREHIEDPGKRSRLRDIEEVSDVLENTKGSDAVEGIKLDLSKVANLHLNAYAFDMMNNLRFLILYTPLGKRSGNVVYPRAFNKFPAKIRYLWWHGYRLKSLPPNFSAKMLVEIRLPYSHVTILWSGMQDVVNLELIDLTECKQLKKLPDLSKASKLKFVNLTGCESLFVIHPSILSLDTLEKLILNNCIRLHSLKSGKHLKSLNKISVYGCTSLKEFSVSSDLMEELDLKDLRIEELHSSIGFLHGLRSLKLDGSDVKRLPESIKHLEKLKVLSLKNCEKLQCLPELPPSIESLSAVNCSSLVKVSTLQTLVGCRDYVFISFQNCEKLDRPLLNSIMDDTLLRMAVVDTNATWNADEKRILKHSVFEMVCLPGSVVPRQFTYRATQAYITMNLPSCSDLFRMVFCVVLSPSHKFNMHGSRIACKCYSADGTKLKEKTEWYHKATTSTDLNSDHVYLWFDTFFAQFITSSYGQQQVSFKFSVADDFLNISIKECGVSLIFKPESQQHRLPIEGYDDDEFNNMNNQRQDLSGESLFSCGCLSGVLRCVLRLISNCLIKLESS